MAWVKQKKASPDTVGFTDTDDMGWDDTDDVGVDSEGREDIYVKQKQASTTFVRREKAS